MMIGENECLGCVQKGANMGIRKVGKLSHKVILKITNCKACINGTFC